MMPLLDNSNKALKCNQGYTVVLWNDGQRPRVAGKVGNPRRRIRKGLDGGGRTDRMRGLSTWAGGRRGGGRADCARPVVPALSPGPVPTGSASCRARGGQY